MCFTVISCFPLPFVTVTLFPVPILLFYCVSVVAFYVFSLCPFCVLYMFFVYYLFVRKLFYQVAYLQYSLSRLVQITLVLFFSLLLSWGCSMFLTFSPISSSCHCFVPFIILYCLYLVLSQYCTICSLVVRYVIFVHISLAFCVVNLVGLGVLFRFLFRHCFDFCSFHMNEQ